MLKSPPTGITVSLPSESDIHKWDVLMQGPQGSVFAVCPSLPSSLTICSYPRMRILFLSPSRPANSISNSSCRSNTLSPHQPLSSQPPSTTQTSLPLDSFSHLPTPLPPSRIHLPVQELQLRHLRRPQPKEALPRLLPLPNRHPSRISAYRCCESTSGNPPRGFRRFC